MLVMHTKREGLEMEKFGQAVDIVRTSHHVPFLLSLLLGVLIIRKNKHTEEANDPVIGDNIPASLMEFMRR